MESDKKLYEVGYLLMPLIAEEKIGEEQNTLRNYIESEGGLIVSEEIPKMRKLAYEVSHNIIGGKKKKYEDAYFGWMKYQLSPDKAETVNASFKKSANVIKFLIINSSVEQPKAPRDESKKAAPKKEKKSDMSEQEIDKEIDKLVVKDVASK